MTLVERPIDPPLVGGPASREPRSCHCADPAVNRLIDLINAGVDQFEASRRIWSPPVTPLVRRPVARGLLGIGLRGRP